MSPARPAREKGMPVRREATQAAVAEFEARRAELESDPVYIQSVLHAGIERATAQAEETLNEVRTAMNMVY